MKLQLSRKIYLNVGLGVVTIISIILTFLFLAIPSNSRDNNNPAKQKEMLEIILEWGRLAPFPTSAENVSIWTEGNRFSRSFRAEFTAPKEDIWNWLEVSPGIAEATVKELPDGKMRYNIDPGGGANYAEVIVDFGAAGVAVYVSWG